MQSRGVELLGPKWRLFCVKQFSVGFFAFFFNKKKSPPSCYVIAHVTYEEMPLALLCSCSAFSV